MKEFRTRFVQTCMLLAGSVLVVVFVAVYWYVHADHYHNLKWTMREMLEPLSQQDPEDLPEDAEKSRFVTVFVSENDIENIRVHGLSADYNTDTLSETINAVLQSSDNFGTLPSQDVIYYRRELPAGCKIAMVDIGYMRETMKGFIILLIILWGCTMILLYGICVFFSKSAVYPLERAKKREKQFVADISHDLKTPLSVVMANNEILLNARDKCVSECLKWIMNSQEAAQSMRIMLNQMLDLYVSDTMNIPVTPVLCDLSVLARKTALQMEALAWEHGIQIKLDVCGKASVTADQDILLRIISILMDNAIKHETAEGSITIKTWTSHIHAFISIHNSSIIEKPDLPYIFERFYRADRSGSNEGHGLGLSIAKRFAEKLGADLDCNSSQTAGTTFTLRCKKALTKTSIIDQ